MPGHLLVVKHAPPFDDQEVVWHPVGQAGGVAPRCITLVHRDMSAVILASRSLPVRRGHVLLLLRSLSPFRLLIMSGPGLRDHVSRRRRAATAGAPGAKRQGAPSGGR